MFHRLYSVPPPVQEKRGKLPVPVCARHGHDHDTGCIKDYWDHRPLTDFWQIGNGKAGRLEKNQMFTMGDIAERTQWDEEWFYHTFGIDAEILIDHAWGIEPVRMCDIKNYKSDSHSLSNGQVLPQA